MRIAGYILGFFLLADGLLTATLPRWWTEQSVHATESVVPQASFMEEFAGLSSKTLRLTGIWESALGLAVLALASRIHDRTPRSA